MRIDKFKHEFNKLNGVYTADRVILLRNPLKLDNMSISKIISTFKSLGETLAY